MLNKTKLENRKTGRPVEVLVVFTPDKEPRPWKFKWTDGREYKKTVIVDEIFSVFSAVGYIRYECASYYEDREKRYELIYWQEECLWELFLI